MKITIAILAGVVLGTVQLLKQTIGNKKFIPPLAIVLGVFFMLLGGKYIGLNELEEKIIIGWVIGLTAMGMWSGTKTLIEKE